MKNRETEGLAFAVIANVLWGILPIYWKSLGSVMAIEVLAHRVFWSFAFATALSLAIRQRTAIRDLMRQRSQLLRVILAAVTITVNWGLYIWAAQSGHILDGSLGYYINPLVAVLFGVIFFKERLNRLQLLVIALALAGVAILVIEFGSFPWISFTLAITFASYGALKKSIQAKPVVSMALESAVVAPLALGFILFRQASGTGALGTAPAWVSLLLLSAGLVTVVPMLMFTAGAQRLPLSTLGIIQYIMPTLMFLLGVFVYHEPFRQANAISFGFIWLAIAIYTYSQIRQANRPARA